MLSMVVACYGSFLGPSAHDGQNLGHENGWASSELPVWSWNRSFLKGNTCQKPWPAGFVYFRAGRCCWNSMNGTSLAWVALFFQWMMPALWACRTHCFLRCSLKRMYLAGGPSLSGDAQWQWQQVRIGFYGCHVYMRVYGWPHITQAGTCGTFFMLFLRFTPQCMTSGKHTPTSQSDISKASVPCNLSWWAWHLVVQNRNAIPVQGAMKHKVQRNTHKKKHAWLHDCYILTIHHMLHISRHAHVCK